MTNKIVLPKNEVFEKAYRKIYMRPDALELGGGQVAKLVFEEGIEQGKLELAQEILDEIGHLEMVSTGYLKRKFKHYGVGFKSQLKTEEEGK